MGIYDSTTRQRIRAFAVTGLFLVSSFSPSLLLGAEESRITKGSTVTIDFSVTTPDKKVVSSTDGKEPLSYVQGEGQIVPGLEVALLGLKAGDRKRVEVQPEHGYGKYDEKKRFSVARNRVPPEAKVGSVLQDKKGEPVHIVELTDTAAVLDRNHPLAGKVITFDVKVLNVEPPP